MTRKEVQDLLLKTMGAKGQNQGISEDFDGDMDQLCTRAEMVRFLYVFHGMDTLNIKINPYRDVTEETEGYNAILWAADMDLLPKEELFRPQEPCTREEAEALYETYCQRRKEEA